MQNNNGSRNCWEFWNCQKEDKKHCLCYQTDSGRECFLVCTYFTQKRVNNYQDCYQCDWYKKVNFRQV